VRRRQARHRQGRPHLARGVRRRHPDHAEADRAEAFARIDTNGDGYIDAAEMDAHHAAKAAEGRCGTHHGQTGPKEAGEGKCGEGKCGEGKCGGMA